MDDVETVKGARLLRALGRKLGRFRQQDEDCRSSSTDSNSSHSHTSSAISPDTREAYSSSDTGSDDSPERRRRHRSTTASFRKVFQNLSISSRSHSCSSGNSDTDKSRSRTTKKNPQPKKILRPPVTYTYVRGLSGLPTQRVPVGRNPYATPRLVLSGLNR